MTHDYIADRLIWLTEMNHESHTQNLERDGEIKSEPFEATRDADEVGDNNGPEAGSDGIDVGNVTGMRDTEPMDCL